MAPELSHVVLDAMDPKSATELLVVHLRDGEQPVPVGVKRRLISRFGLGNVAVDERLREVVLLLCLAAQDEKGPTWVTAEELGRLPSMAGMSPRKVREFVRLRLLLDPSLRDTERLVLVTGKPAKNKSGGAQGGGAPPECRPRIEYCDGALSSDATYRLSCRATVKVAAGYESGELIQSLWDTIKSSTQNQPGPRVLTETLPSTLIDTARALKTVADIAEIAADKRPHWERNDEEENERWHRAITKLLQHLAGGAVEVTAVSASLAYILRHHTREAPALAHRLWPVIQRLAALAPRLDVAWLPYLVLKAACHSFVLGAADIALCRWEQAVAAYESTPETVDALLHRRSSEWELARTACALSVRDNAASPNTFERDCELEHLTALWRIRAHHLLTCMLLHRRRWSEAESYLDALTKLLRVAPSGAYAEHGFRSLFAGFLHLARDEKELAKSELRKAISHLSGPLLEPWSPIAPSPGTLNSALGYAHYLSALAQDPDSGEQEEHMKLAKEHLGITLAHTHGVCILELDWLHKRLHPDMYRCETDFEEHP